MLSTDLRKLKQKFKIKSTLKLKIITKLKIKTPKRNFTIVLLVPTLTHLPTILSSISSASTVIKVAISSRCVLSNARMARKFNQWTRRRWQMWCASVESKNSINGATGVRAQVYMILAMNERIFKFFIWLRSKFQ